MLNSLGIYIVLAGLPSFLLLRYFYKRDNLKAEPKGQVIKVFIFGCLTIIPAIVFERLIILFKPTLSPEWDAFFQAFVVAALVEEGIKFLLIRSIMFRMSAFDEVTDGIVYTIAAGLGFAFFENIAYGLQNYGNIWVLLLRAVTAVPLHCLASGLMGYFLGLAWKDRRKSGLAGLILAIIVHGLYDFVLFSPTRSPFWILALLPVGYLLLGQMFRNAQKRDVQVGLT